MVGRIIIFGLCFVLLFFFLSNVFSGNLILSSAILKLGRFEIRYYSVFILTGVVLAYILARKRALKEGVKAEQLDELIFYAIIFGIVGARLFYVIFNWNYYRNNFIEIFMVWHGGLAIQGAIVFGITVFILYSKIKKNLTFSIFQALDLGALYLPLGQSIGRWGNLFNYEAFGGPTTLPWKMYVPSGFRPIKYINYEYFHPTFLYESIWDFSIFLLLILYIERHRKNHGEVFALYLCFYSLGRICIESLRLDSLFWGEVRVAQLFSAILMIAGFILFLYRRGGLSDLRDR